MSEVELSQTLLSQIVGQAAVILVACSILLTVIKDLFDVRAEEVGPPDRREIKVLPVLKGLWADWLRVTLRVFAWGLPAFYFVIALAVIVVEQRPLLTDTAGKATKVWQVAVPYRANMIDIDLFDIYYWELVGHLFVVLFMAVLFGWMFCIRRKDLQQRQGI